MYCSFFGIQEKPFSITPDPKYLYLGKTHQEAFAHLVYGIRERGGFIVVTGGIGTGKTTLCRALLTHLDADMRVAFIFNPTLSALELLQTINEDLGIRSEGSSQKERIDALNRFLLEQRQQGRNTVLIIDEAQNLDLEVLEHVRLLSNLETDTEKLLQIILIGQPEFREMLEQPRLLQLNQRVTVRYHLKPLSREEADAYVRHRLTVAGADDKIRFTPQALKRISRYTRGVPRLINVLCDRALLAGYTRRTREIDGDMVKQAHREVSGHGAGSRFPVFLRALRSGILPGLLAAAVLLLAGFGFHYFRAQWKATDVVRDPGSTLARGQGPEPGTVEPARLPLEQDAPGVVPAPGPDEGPIQATESSGPDPLAADPTAVSNRDLAPLKTEAGGEEAQALETTTDAPKPEAPAGPVIDPNGQPEGERVRVLSLLEKSLAGRTIQETLDQSLLAVLEPWKSGTPEKGFRSGGPAGEDIYTAAAAMGFQVYRLQGSFQSIRALNLPAVLELKLGEVLGRRYVALVGLEGAWAEIRPFLSDGSGLVPERILEGLWFGNAYILWKDWVGGRPALMEGNQGEEVAWLQSALKELGYLSGEPTGTFGKNTGLAVRDFQRASGLEDDGILGPQTKIVLFRTLKKFPMPLLETGGKS